MYENTTTFTNMKNRKVSSYFGINPNYNNQTQGNGTPCFGRTTMGCENNYIRSPQG
jgi:hypothetical protein